MAFQGFSANDCDEPKRYAAHPEVSAEMYIEWDVPIEMDDGLVLRADVFRPDETGEYPGAVPMAWIAGGTGSAGGERLPPTPTSAPWNSA